MELIWWGAAILGMTLLAGCIGWALLRPGVGAVRSLRPLANTGRLTRLPEYLRAVRRRALVTVVSIVLLAIAFTAALLAFARPTGLPAVTGHTESRQPEDIMVCVAGPVDAPAVGRTLGFFAERVRTFGTERIGLTSVNRRVIPLTRDYQYAAAQFGAYARAGEDDDELTDFVAPVNYADYTPSIEDTLALCLTGLPPFDAAAPQRRSVIYVGPGALDGTNADTGADASMFTAERLHTMATTAGIQIDALYTSPGGPALDALVRDTGGLSQAATPEVTAQLERIRSRPPPPSETDAGTTVAHTVETPDIPIVMALTAMLALALWPLVVRT